jgi:hypothetical protein
MSGPRFKPQDGKYHAAAAFDVTHDPPELVLVGLTRAEVREKIKWREDADNLRIRRVRLRAYES